MPHCINCGKSQARFKDGSLCTKCFNDHNSGQVKLRNNDDTPLQLSIGNPSCNKNSFVDNAAIDIEKKSRRFNNWRTPTVISTDN